MKVLTQSNSGQNTFQKDDSTKTAEIFGQEMVVDLVYPIPPGARIGLYSWRGCTIEVHGPCLEEKIVPNMMMRDFVNCCGILEQRRVRAEELNATGPRVLITGANGSGKSTLTETMVNYALRRERLPVYVELDPRYTPSVTPRLQGLPSCIHATSLNYLEDDVFDRISFFFGHLEWSENQKLYQQIVSRLATVVKTKLGNTDKVEAEAKTIALSGCIINAPNNPTTEVLEHIIREFDIDVVLAVGLDQTVLQNLKSVFHSSEGVEIVRLNPSGGAVLEKDEKLTQARSSKMYEYYHRTVLVSDDDKNQNFVGRIPKAIKQVPFTGVFNLREINLLQYQVHQVTDNVSMVGGAGAQLQVVDKLSAVPFPPHEVGRLMDTALAVIRAQSEEELQYAQLAGFIIVTGVDTVAGTISVALPDQPPLPSNYFLVPGDIPGMTFADALK